MAATLSKYRSQLIEFIEQYSRDSDYSDRYYEELIITYRNKWFQNTYNKFNSQIPEIYFQTLSCVEIEKADQAECCEVDSGCDIMRTKEIIPSFISLSDGEVFVKSWPVSITNKPTHLFDVIPYERADVYGNLRYNSSRIASFYYNNRVYFIAKNNPRLSLIEKVNIRGAFRDPRDVGRFIDCQNKPCWTDNSIFPFEERLWTYAFEDIKKVLVQKLEIPQDMENNAKSDLEKE